MEIESLPEPLRKLVSEELAAGERVRWVGQPAPSGGALLRASLLPMFLSGPIIAVMLYWIGSAAGVFDRPGRSGHPMSSAVGYVFALAGLPGLAVGVAMLAAPLWLPGRVRAAARRTAYVITDRRAIVFDGGYLSDRGMYGLISVLRRFREKGTAVRSYPPEKLVDIERTQREDGSGDVIFHEEERPAEDAGETPVMLREGFLSVPRVKEVEELLRALAKTGPARDQR